MPTIRSPVRLPSTILSREEEFRIGTITGTGSNVVASKMPRFITASLARSGAAGGSTVDQNLIRRDATGSLIRPTVDNLASSFGFISTGRGRGTSVQAQAALGNFFRAFTAQGVADTSASNRLADNASRRRAFLAGKPVIGPRGPGSRVPADANSGTLVRRTGRRPSSGGSGAGSDGVFDVGKDRLG